MSMTRTVFAAAMTIGTVLLWAGAPPVFVQSAVADTAAQTAPAPPQGRGGGPAGQPGQGGGRGRGAAPIQPYPADPNTVIQALHGFRVEIVATADRPTQGSWISLVEDDQGRIILGANEQQPFTRLTLDERGVVIKTETIATPVSEAMGMEWHDGALYVQGGRLEQQWAEINLNPSWGHENGYTGLHRMRDPNADGSFSDIVTLRRWDGDEGGHSDHGVHDPEVSPTAGTSTSSMATASCRPTTSRRIRRCATLRTTASFRC
jgi:hypothetical protein